VKEKETIQEAWPLIFSVEKFFDTFQQPYYRSKFTFYLPDKKIMYIIKEYEEGLYTLPLFEQQLIVTSDEEDDALVLSYVVYKRITSYTK